MDLNGQQYRKPGSRGLGASLSLSADNDNLDTESSAGKGSRLLPSHLRFCGCNHFSARFQVLGIFGIPNTTVYRHSKVIPHSVAEPPAAQIRSSCSHIGVCSMTNRGESLHAEAQLNVPNICRRTGPVHLVTSCYIYRSRNQIKDPEHQGNCCQFCCNDPSEIQVTTCQDTCPSFGTNRKVGIPASI